MSADPLQVKWRQKNLQVGLAPWHGINVTAIRLWALLVLPVLTVV